MPNVRNRGDHKIAHATGTVFEVCAVLLRAASLDAPKNAEDWRERSDHWRVTVYCAKGGAAVTKETPRVSFDYWTGVGLRQNSQGKTLPQNLRTLYEYSEAERLYSPVHPTAKDILLCMALDWNIAEEMPREDAAALNHCAAEFGDGMQPGDILRMVRGLREAHDNVAALLRGSGISPSDFAAWASELDS